MEESRNRAGCSDWRRGRECKAKSGVHICCVSVNIYCVTFNLFLWWFFTIMYMWLQFLLKDKICNFFFPFILHRRSSGATIEFQLEQIQCTPVLPNKKKQNTPQPEGGKQSSSCESHGSGQLAKGLFCECSCVSASLQMQRVKGYGREKIVSKRLKSNSYQKQG